MRERRLTRTRKWLLLLLGRLLLLRRSLLCWLLRMRALGSAKCRVLRWQVCWRRLVRGRLLVLRRRGQTTVRRRWRALSVLVWAQSFLARRAGTTRCHRRLRRCLDTVTRLVRVERLRWALRVLQLCDSVASPVVASGERWGSRASRRTVLRVGSPLRTRRTTKSTWLVRLRVDVLGQWRTSLVGKAIGRLSLEQSKTCLDMDV